MGTFLYFAYGSNMLTPCLIRRCQSASVVGPAYADGHEVTFSKKSTRDGSGKAALIPTAQHGRQYGVLVEISDEDRDCLDREEGAGKGYDPIERFPVALAADSASVNALTYQATAIEPSLQPFDWYLALVVQGAVEHGLPQAQIDRFRQMPFIPDPDLHRTGRREALEILRSVGCTDLMAVLGRAAL